MNINWEAVAAMASCVVLIGGVVRYTVKGTLAEFKDELRKDFATKEWASEVERRLSRLETEPR